MKTIQLKIILLFAAFIFPALGFSQSLTIKNIRKISSDSGGLNRKLGQNEYFGYVIADIGDLNGDGIDDLAVSAGGDGTNGALFILFMKADGTLKASKKISADSGNIGYKFPTGGEGFGCTVTSIDDMDGDGVIDLAVGALGDNGGYGAVFILFMNKDGSVKKSNILDKNDPILSSYLTGGGFGGSINAIGDLDGDHVMDLAVSATNENASMGAVYILFMKSDGSIKSAVHITSSTAGMSLLSKGDQFGYTVCNMGDFNKDGVNDLIVGAPGDQSISTNTGVAYILEMKTNGNIKNVITINGKSQNTINSTSGIRFGCSVAGIPDVDGDGIIDVMAGAFGVGDAGKTLSGAFYVICLDSSGKMRSNQKFSASTTALSNYLNASDQFGAGVRCIKAPSGGKCTIAVGAHYDADGNKAAGAIYLLGMTGAKSSIMNNITMSNDLGINIYPNPASYYLNIAFNAPSNGAITYMLSDMQGRLVYNNTTQGVQGVNTLDINTLMFPRGLYMLKIQQNEYSGVVKFMKE